MNEVRFFFTDTNHNLHFNAEILFNIEQFLFLSHFCFEKKNRTQYDYIIFNGLWNWRSSICSFASKCAHKIYLRFICSFDSSAYIFVLLNVHAIIITSKPFPLNRSTFLAILTWSTDKKNDETLSFCWCVCAFRHTINYRHFCVNNQTYRQWVKCFKRQTK